MASEAKCDALRGLAETLKVGDAEGVASSMALLTSSLEDSEPDVRRQAISTLEEAGKANGSLFPAIIPLLTARLVDESAPIVKRCLAASTSLFRRALGTLLNGGVDDTAGVHLWQSFARARPCGGDMLPSARTDAVRTAAAKCCEMLVLAFFADPFGRRHRR